MWYLAIFMTPRLKKETMVFWGWAGVGGSQTFLSYICGGVGREFFSKGDGMGGGVIKFFAHHMKMYPPPSLLINDYSLK